MYPLGQEERIHLPKGLGGIGVRSLHILNKIFPMKKVWYMYTKPTFLMS